MNTLRNLGMQQQQPTLASFGQRYQDMPPATFDQRFGPYQVPPQQGLTNIDSAELLRLLRQKADEQQLRSTPEAIIPGQELVDPNGYRGVRHPSGYYLLRGVEAPRPTLQRMAANDVTDSGIPTPQYVRPTPEDEIPPHFRPLPGVAPRKTNEPSQEEIDATVRLNQQQYEDALRRRGG